jgi:putative ATPase
MPTKPVDRKEPAEFTPLAERMRPQTLDRFYGQDHLIGEGKILTQLIQSGRLVSMIFWGPPGSGKTTLAFILAKTFDLPWIFFSAVLSGIKEVKEVMAKAETHKRMYRQPTIIFIDEIHRFNKAQQGAFLPYVEKGDIVLFGSTTENPSFEVIAPLLSRMKVLILNPLGEETLIRILTEALRDEEKGLGHMGLKVGEEVLGSIIRGPSTRWRSRPAWPGRASSRRPSSKRPCRSGCCSTTRPAKSILI